MLFLLLDLHFTVSFFPDPSLAFAYTFTVCPIPFFFALTTPFWVTEAYFLLETYHLTFLLEAFFGLTDAFSFSFFLYRRVALFFLKLTIVTINVLLAGGEVGFLF